MIARALVFPDTDALVGVYLDDQLADLERPPARDVLIPSPRPERLVVNRRQPGGTRPNRVCELVTVAFTVFAESEPDVVELTEVTRGLVYAMPGTVPGVYRVGDPSSAPGPLEDVSDAPCRRFTASLLVRAVNA